MIFQSFISSSQMMLRKLLSDASTIQLLIIICTRVNQHARGESSFELNWFLTNCTFRRFDSFHEHVGELENTTTLTCGENFFAEVDCKSNDQFTYDARQNLTWYRLSEERFKLINSSERLSTFLVKGTSAYLKKVNCNEREWIYMHSVTQTDTGWYLCVHGEKTIVKSFFLNVTCDDFRYTQTESAIAEIENGTALPYFGHELLTPIIHKNSTAIMLAFECDFRGYPSGNISTWMDNNPLSPVELEEYPKCSNSASLLTKDNMRNSRNITCNACNSNGCVNKTTMVKVTNDEPMLVKATRNTEIQVGKSIILECEYFSSSSPWFTVSSRGGPQRYFPNSQHFNHKLKYTISREFTNITKTDEGIYAFAAVNLSGTRFQLIYLKVNDHHDDPKKLFRCYHYRDETTLLEETSLNFTVSCGNDFLIKCEADRTKNIELLWYHLPADVLEMNYSITSNISFQVQTNFPIEKPSLEVSGVTTNDTGWYTAIITRTFEGVPYSTTLHNFWLEVVCDKQSDPLINVWLERIKNGTGPPYFTTKSKENSISLDPQQKICLLCHVRGYPSPQFNWTRNNILKKQLVSENEYCLRVNNAQDNSGHYTCTACNANDCIKCEYRVQIGSEKPVLKRNSVANNIHIGDSVNLTCEFSSDSIPWTTEWEIPSTHHNPKVEEKAKKIHHDFSGIATLILDNLTEQDTGFYVCSATNIRGQLRQSISVNVLKGFEDDSNQITILLVAGLIIPTAISLLLYYLYYDMKKKRKAEAVAMMKWIKKIKIERIIEIDEEPSESLIAPIVTIETIEAAHESDVSSDVDYEIPLDENWEFAREKLNFRRILGEGEFGKVFQAEADGILEENVTTTVAVKTLKDNHEDSDMINLVTELEIMKLVGNHRNILCLLGCCSQKGPLLVISEYAENGNLQDFLRQHCQKKNNISENILLRFEFEIATGMEYMTSIRCVHRDLAARNILVSKNLTMKIGDFGLARDVRHTYYYKKTSDGRLPIKWMAPESILYNRYSTQSDVWSYGILLWEVETRGGTPYPCISDTSRLFKELRKGYRMERPTMCSGQMYQLMLDCWKYHPDDRPNFTSILITLKNMIVNLETRTHTTSNCESTALIHTEHDTTREEDIA